MSKDSTIDRITVLMKEMAEEIMTSIPSKEKLEDMNIVLDVVRFISDYDKNIAILNTYHETYTENTKEEK